MPVMNGDKSSNAAGNSARTVFRPPWVREGPSPLPMPSNMPTMKPSAWASKSNNTRPSTSESATPQPLKPVLRKQTKITIPIEPTNNEQNSSKASEKTIPIRVESTRPTTQPAQRSEKVIPVRTENLKSTQPVNRPTQQQPPEPQQPSWRRTKNPEPTSKAKDKMPPTASKPPPSPASTANPPPPPPPMAGPPPPPPPMMGGGDLDTKPPIAKQPLTKEKAARLEALRSRPRRRPDWSDMMKEVESGRKLKHVQCNDRSAPVIPQQKAKGQFVYESEKKEDNDRNKFLKQIQGGIKLNKVKTNDRSKPNLDGLRKFRREMTIEEQIQKSVSMADVVAAAVDPDELDDIDKVRDDLQSAKQMLALELRNKEAIERENKRLIARLANLEAELEKEKATRTSEDKKGRPVRTDEDEKLIASLKEEAVVAERTAKDMEQKYHTTAEQLDNMRRKLESAWLQNQELEQQLKSVSQGTPLNQLMRQPSKKFIPIANGGSVDLISDDEEEESETETEEADSDIEEAGSQEKQTARELKLLTTKLKTFKEKQAASLKERRILRDQLKKRQNELKEEKRKYKILQKEVDKMAKLMREHEGEMEEDDDTVEEELTETESESEESEEEAQSDEEVPAGATAEEKRKLLLERTKRHENRLASLKKGNNLMKANIERLQDDINRQQENAITLQEDLNNILADLG